MKLKYTNIKENLKGRVKWEIWAVILILKLYKKYLSSLSL